MADKTNKTRQTRQASNAAMTTYATKTDYVAMKSFAAGQAKPSHAKYNTRPESSRGGSPFSLFAFPNYGGREVEFISCGQDTIARVKHWKGVLGPDEHLSGVFDGHGTLGHKWSYFVSRRLIKCLLQNWFTIKKMLRKGGKPISERQQLVRTHLKQLFRTVEEECAGYAHDRSDHNGGTTATVNFVMIVRRRRCIFQAAVGDSPGFIAPITKNRQDQVWDCDVEQGPTEANADNKRAVEEFAQRHLDKKLPIPPIYFNRINVGWGFPSVQTGTDPETGRELYRRLPAWRYLNHRGELDVQTDQDSYAILKAAGIIYGGQTLHLPKVKQIDGKWVLKDESQAASANFGNSVQGNGQNTTGFGDLVYGMDSDCDASVHFYSPYGDRCQDPVMVFCYSDGLGDILTPAKWAQLIREHHRHPYHETMTHRHLKEMALAHKDDPNNTYRWEGPDGLNPTHDDMSCTGIMLPAWLPPRRRRSHRQNYMSPQNRHY